MGDQPTVTPLPMQNSTILTHIHAFSGIQTHNPTLVCITTVTGALKINEWQPRKIKKSDNQMSTLSALDK